MPDLRKPFNDEVTKIFGFLVDEYEFELKKDNELLYIAENGNIKLFLLFDMGSIFGVEIRVDWKAYSGAEGNPIYSKRLGVSGMAKTMEPPYNLRIRTIKGEDELIEDMEEEARVLRKYFSDILAGNLSNWPAIVDNFLAKKK